MIRRLEQYFGQNLVAFVREHRAFSAFGVGLVVAYGLYLYGNRSLYTVVAPGGHGSLVTAATPERARGVTQSWIAADQLRHRRADTAEPNDPCIMGQSAKATDPPLTVPWAVFLCAFADLLAVVCYSQMLRIAIKRAGGAFGGAYSGTLLMLSVVQNAGFVLLYLAKLHPAKSWVITAFWAYWIRLLLVGACLIYLYVRLSRRSRYAAKAVASVTELGRVVNWSAFSLSLVAILCFLSSTRGRKTPRC